MLHIILTILKIIGIILAALLGIVLTVILVVLFVPIGYDARIDNRNDILVKANGWWLFHALHLSFAMEGIPSEEKGNSPVIKLRILGIPIIDTSKKKEKTQTKVEKPEAKAKETSVELKKKEPQLTIQELQPKEEPVKSEQNKATSKETVKTETLKEDVKEDVKKSEVKKPEVKKVEVKRQERKKPERKKRVSLIERIRAFIDGIKRKLQNISDTKQKIQEKLSLLKAFIQNEENVNGIKKIFHSIKKLLKHLLPNRIKGQVQFGLNDPCATGQALGVLAMIYPYYGKSLTIEPDFTKQVLQGEVYLKGYIQIFTLCIIAIKLLIDANFRKLIKNFKVLKEEL